MPTSGGSNESALQALEALITACRRCPRLVSWREQVARERKAAFAGQRYWGRPVPGFGDPRARILLLGLAPAAHGANRTGRMFTGDRSGDFLYAAMHRARLASQPTSTARDDGLRLHGAWVTAAVRCAPPANRPTGAERDACLPWSVNELALLPHVRVIICLGAFAWNAALGLTAAASAVAIDRDGSQRSPSVQRSGPSIAPLQRPRPRFGHGAELAGARSTLVGCSHPSQQNTFTGRLTADMIDAVLARACQLAGSSPA
jgi:uracil-DNA glycosylase